MTSIFHLVQTNIKKNKGNTMAFLLILTLTFILLGVGISVVMQTDGLYEQKSEELHSAHGVFWIKKDEFKESYLDLLKSDETIAEVHREEAIYLNGATIDFGASYESNSILMNMDEERTISPVKLLSSDPSIPRTSAIYLPYSAVNVGYQIGDTFQISYKQTKYEFTVAGFHESVEMILANSIALQFYLPQEAYQTLVQRTGAYQYISFRCNEMNQAVKATERFKDESNIDFSMMAIGNGICDLQDLREVITMPPMIIAGLLMGISLIIVVVTLLFLSFRITNSIEDNMENFGALQALGYTTGQIIRSYIIEYSLISIVGSIIGVCGTLLLFSPLEQIIASMCGVVFGYRADILLLVFILIFLTGCISCTVWWNCRNIRRFTPVVSLRGGTSTHSFKKNHMPLNIGISSVHIRLGLKNIFMNVKSYLMVGLIIAGITTILSFCVIIYQNFVSDKTALLDMTGVEVSDLNITLTKHTDAKVIAQDMEQLDGVVKTSMLDWISFRADNKLVAGYCSDDFSKLETISTTRGNLPLLDNEVAVSGALAKYLGKGIGDSVMIKVNGFEKEYFITGLFSTLNGGGMAVHITLEGLRRVDPGYQQAGINIYLDKDIDLEVMTQRLGEQFGIVGRTGDVEMSAAQKRAEEKIAIYMERYDVRSIDYAVMKDGELLFSGSGANQKLSKITNFRDTMEAQLGAFEMGISAFIQITFIIAFIVIFLVLQMTVKNMIRRQHLELGIQKAVGFETIQLMIQYTVSFLPSIIIGAVLGEVISSNIANPIMTVMFSAAGATSSSMKMDILLLTLFGLGVIIVSTAIVLLTARKIRKISPYELISE